MQRDDSYYRELLGRFLENQCNPNELKEVFNFLESKSSNRMLLQKLAEEFNKPGNVRFEVSNEQSNRIREIVLQKIHEAPVISLHKRRRLYFMVAAAIILICTGIYFFVSVGLKQTPRVAKTEVKKPYKDDVQPGGNKAVLTLADGSTIALNTVQDGNIAQEGNTKILKLNGKLAYNATNSGTNEILYNTISTPRGGQYQVELPDGSQVWLNAGSSLHFPTAFVTKERMVEVTGEVYFEVSKNDAMPFVVKVNGAEIHVLGTHFNINAYEDEASLKTTLLEGSVKFSHGSESKVLKPGQQTHILKSGQIRVSNNVDINEVTAWKNGRFYFDGADIGTILRQLSRWYDVEIINETRINDLFYAKIPRNIKLSDVLKALELTGKIRFKIDGRKIIVLGG